MSGETGLQLNSDGNAKSLAQKSNQLSLIARGRRDVELLLRRIPELPEPILRLRCLAEAGDAEAQVNLGKYCEGWTHEGCRLEEEDYAEAVFWYRKAAEQGNANGQYSLGDAYKESKGVEKDLAAAASWYSKAADQNHLYAICDLANLYRDGQGVQQDYSKALQYYRVAADKEWDCEVWDPDAIIYMWREAAHLGYAPAQHYHAYILFCNHQRYSPKHFSIVEAYMWATLAIADGPSMDAIMLRDEIAAKLSPDEIAEGQRLAREWKPRGM